MGIFELMVLSLALSADAFTVGAAVGLQHSSPRQVFRLSFHFGLFQSLLSLAGIVAGAFFAGYIENWDHWIAFALLVLIGGRMIAGLGDDDEKREDADPTRGSRLIGFSLAVSIDALAAGIGLGAVGAPVALSTAVIGITACAATAISMKMAGEVSRRFGGRLEPLAGVVLILLGIKIVIEHMGYL